MIPRFITKTIIDCVKHFPITLLTGPRQIGKSTELFNSFNSKGFNYISLDDSFNLAFARRDPRSFLDLHPSPLIIDEAQKAPELFVEIERIVNESRLKRGNMESNGMYILSGSQRKDLLDRAEESLSGRVAILDMNNLSINEILGKDNSPFEVNLAKDSQRSLRYTLKESQAFEYIVKGFFPVLYADPSINTSVFYSSYITTYLGKDLRDLININDEFKFLNFLKLLASNTGEELVYDNYAKNIGVSINTIKSWTSVLIKTAIIYLVEPYNEESIVKRVVKRPKMYFFDTGLAAYLCGITDAKTLQNSFLKGRFFETFVFNEIRKSFMNEGIMQTLYYYRDSEQNEVDMILVREGKISCVEIKAGQNFNVSDTKAFKNLLNSKFVHGKNAIVCTADKISMLNDGTLLLPISSI